MHHLCTGQTVKLCLGQTVSWSQSLGVNSFFFGIFLEPSEQIVTGFSSFVFFLSVALACFFSNVFGENYARMLFPFDCHRGFSSNRIAF